MRKEVGTHDGRMAISGQRQGVMALKLCNVDTCVASLTLVQARARTVKSRPPLNVKTNNRRLYSKNLFHKGCNFGFPGGIPDAHFGRLSTEVKSASVQRLHTCMFCTCVAHASRTCHDTVRGRQYLVMPLKRRALNFRAASAFALYKGWKLPGKALAGLAFISAGLLL
eukprot:347701-Chlamydomonas_euryale.AAC.4